MLSFSRIHRKAAFASLLVLLLVTVLALADSSSSASSQAVNSCDAHKRKFTCPNCGGMEVEDCLKCDDFVSTDLVHGICFRRVLFNQHNVDVTDYENHYHYLWNDLLGMIVWFFTAAIAISAGVGGGGIYVPLGIFLFQFAPKQASGLSQASVFGASLGGLLLNVRNFHPNERIRSDAGVPDDKDKSECGRVVQLELPLLEEEKYVAHGGRLFTRPLIHYDMALFLAPMEMAGAVLGVLIQKILPNWLYLLFAGIILGITSYKTYMKYFSTRKTEERREAIMVSEYEGDDSERVHLEHPEYGPLVTIDDDPLAAPARSRSLLSGKINAQEQSDESDAPTAYSMETGMDLKLDNDKGSAVTRSPMETSSDEVLQQRIAFLEADAVQYPGKKIFALIILWVGLLVLTLMKGGKGVESIVGITCESPWYIVLIVIQFVYLFSFACSFGLKLHRDQAARIQVNYPYMEDDPNWDWRSLQLFGLFTFLAGVVAGLIGVGGGMVLGPLMIEMGVNPRVSSATTATMIVLTASSVVFMVITSGMIHWSYAAFYFCVCVCGALFGKSKIDAYVKKTGKASLIIFILATIIAAATIGCLVIMLLGLVDNNWCLDGFNQFCTVSNSDDGNCPAERLLGEVSKLAFPKE